MRYGTIALVLSLAACSSGQDQQNVEAPDTNEATTVAVPAAPTPAPQEGNESGEAKPVRGTVLTATGWGPLTIGMTKAAVTKALGADASPGANGPDPSACEQYRPARAPAGMMVMLEQGRLSRITLDDDAKVETAKGIGIGASADAVVKAYGTAAHRSPHKYLAAPAEYITIWSKGGGDGYVRDEAARGIVFETGKDGKVEFIHAGGPSIQYVEGCA